MRMSEEMISPHAMRAVKNTDQQLLIALRDHETKQRSRSGEALVDVSIKMFETHRRRRDESSDVFAAQNAESQEPPRTHRATPTRTREITVANGNLAAQKLNGRMGATAMFHTTKPKRPGKARKSPWRSRDGKDRICKSIPHHTQFNSGQGDARGKGEMIRWRC